MNCTFYGIEINKFDLKPCNFVGTRTRTDGLQFSLDSDKGEIITTWWTNKEDLISALKIALAEAEQLPDL